MKVILQPIFTLRALTVYLLDTCMPDFGRKPLSQLILLVVLVLVSGSGLSAPGVSNVSGIKCKELISYSFSQILSTDNTSFHPTKSYAKLFEKALKDFKPTDSNFVQAMEYFLNVRIKIAKQNRNDNDLLLYLDGAASESERHRLGKAEDSTNVTALYPLEDYGDISIRYSELYEIFQKLHQESKFQISDDNEVANRYRKQAAKMNRKFKSIINPDRKWIINYVDIEGRRIPISGVVRASTYDENRPLYGIYNSFSKDVPYLLQHISQLWSSILTENDTLVQKKLIAEFEWYFFNANPLGRAAASIGDVMSLSLQIKLNLNIREKFVHLDFFALSKSLQEYVSWRVEHWP